MPVEIEEFGDFAETTLNNHLVELHSLLIQSGSYQDELMTEAYKKHQQLLSIELNIKLEALSDGHYLEPVVKQGLLAIKRKYESNLVWNKK